MAEEVYISQYAISLEALVQVRKAAPQPVAVNAANVQMIVKALEVLGVKENARYGLDGKPYYRVHTDKVAELYTKLSGDVIDARRMGFAVNKLGLGKVHMNDGNAVVWNDEQVTVLKKAVGL